MKSFEEIRNCLVVDGMTYVFTTHGGTVYECNYIPHIDEPYVIAPMNAEIQAIYCSTFEEAIMHILQIIGELK